MLTLLIMFSKPPILKGMTGLSWTELLMDLSNRVHWLGIDLSRAFRSGSNLSLPIRIMYPWGAMQWWKNVDYLLIAKPVAINHLRIRHDCARGYPLPVVCSSLWRPWSLLLQQGEVCLKFVRSGNKVFHLLVLICEYTLESISALHLNLQLSVMNSRPRKWFPTMSSGRLHLL